MGSFPPPPPTPPRRTGLGPRVHADPRALLGLGLCGVVWAVAITPQRQPLEGTLQVSALSFVLQGPSDESRTSLQGVLATPLRGLTIKGLGETPPLVLGLRGQRLSLKGGSTLSLRAGAAAPMMIKIALPQGTRIGNLQLENKNELVVDLSPPKQASQGSVAAELTITPPLSTTAPPAGMVAVFQAPAQKERRIVPPESDFSLLLAADTRLRLHLADPKTPTVFEANLPVRDVRFTSERNSLFDQLLIPLSTLRSGTLHLGRQPPLSLRTHQFLQIDPPGIGLLTSLRTERGQLAVEVVGQTSRIQAGLSIEHPSTELRGTLLSRHLTPEQVSGFFGFLAGVMSSLVLTLFKGD